MKSFIYRWTNIITDEYYIGVHKGTPDDGYIGSGKKFKAKYNKHPSDFVREIVQFCNTYEEALLIESKLVTLETLKDSKCLNLKPGGQGGGLPDWNQRIDRKCFVAKRRENAEKLGLSYCQHRIGYKFDDNQKAIMAEKAKRRKKVECPHCKKLGPKPQMSRWHFDSCKELQR
jgi:hypothetical protein